MDAENEEKALVHCIYTSAQTVDFSHEDIFELLAVARATNSALEVTGVLLYDSGSFFQVLEGEPEVVDELYEKIGKDKRHDRVSKIIYESIASRNFSEWTMGYAGITREEIKTISGFNDFFHGQKNFIDLDEGRAKTLLDAFKEGKWRASIS